MRYPDRNSRISEISDGEMGRILRTGTLIGLPLVFVASTALTLRVGLVNSLAIAVLPTLFSGSFVGGLILLMRALGKAERNALTIPVPDHNQGRRLDARHPPDHH